MRIFIVDCEVEYSGRGETFLPRGARAVIIKKDGAVSIHSDSGNKPINYMPTGSMLTVKRYKNYERWMFETKKEKIVLKIFDILEENDYHIPEADSSLQRYKTEKQLQKELSLNPNPIINYYSYDTADNHNLEVFVEYATNVGSIDLLIHNHTLRLTHIVELKRVAMLGAVDQCVRYYNAYMNSLENKVDYHVTVAVAAFDIRPNTLLHAETNNIDCIVLR